jgi:hypothetical protein
MAIYMIKQYPLRIDDNIWRKAKSKAALVDVTLRLAVEQLLEGWVEGKYSIPGNNGNPETAVNGKA